MSDGLAGVLVGALGLIGAGLFALDSNETRTRAEAHTNEIIAKAKDNAAREISEQQDKHTKATKQITTDCTEKVIRCQKESNDKFNQMQTFYESALKTARDEQEKTINQMKRSCDQTCDDLRADYEMQCEKLKLKQELELSKAVDAERSRLNTEHQKTMAMVKDNFNSKIQALKKENKEAMAEIISTYEASNEKMALTHKDALDKQTLMSQDHVEQAFKKSEVLVGTMKSDMSKETSSLKKAHAVFMDKLHTNLDQIKATSEFQKSNLDSETSQIGKASKVLKGLKDNLVNLEAKTQSGAGDASISEVGRQIGVLRTHHDAIEQSTSLVSEGRHRIEVEVGDMQRKIKAELDSTKDVKS